MSADIGLARCGALLLERLELQRQPQAFHAHVAIGSDDAIERLLRLRAVLLTPEEGAYFDTLVAERRRASYLLGRYVAKQAVCAYLHEGDLRRVHIASGVFQQPIVCSTHHARVQVTLAHSEPWAVALAFPEAHPMGVDVECMESIRRIDPWPWRTAEEARRIDALGLPDHQALGLLWTIKEALSKVLKTGLTASFEVFELMRIQRTDRMFESLFRHFGQYKALSWFFGDYAWSIVLPKLTLVRVDHVVDALDQLWPAGARRR